MGKREPLTASDCTEIGTVMCSAGKLYLLIFIVVLMIAVGVPQYNQAIRHDLGLTYSVLIGVGAAVSFILGCILSCYIIAAPVYLIRHKKDQWELNVYATFVSIALCTIAVIIGLIMMVKSFVLWIM